MSLTPGFRAFEKIYELNPRSSLSSRYLRRNRTPSRAYSTSDTISRLVVRAHIPRDFEREELADFLWNMAYEQQISRFSRAQLSLSR